MPFFSPQFIVKVGAPAAFTPNTLSPLLWLDASDLTTLFQDSAGTTPVTTSTDPVGKWNDKSGNGNHFTQATSGLRPQYQNASGRHFLVTDGVDDMLASAARIMQDTDNTVCMAYEFATQAGSNSSRPFSQFRSAQGGRFVWSANNECAGSSYSAGKMSVFWAGAGAGGCSGGGIQELTIGNNTRTVNTLKGVLTTSESSTITQDGVLKDTFTGASQYNNCPTELFANTSLGGLGVHKIYQVVIVGSALSGANQTLLETYMAGKIA